MSVVRDIIETGAAETADIARALGTTHRTVERWSTGQVTPRRDAVDRLLELKAVIDLAIAVMQPGSAAMWLRSPVPALDYGKPLDLICDGEFRRVIGALEAPTGGG